MVAESGSGLEKFLGLGAALDEVVDGTLWRNEAVGGLERIRSLNLGGAVRDTGQNAGVNHSDIAAGNSGGDHHLLNNQATDKILGSSDVLYAFSNGPAIGSRFEVPLSWRSLVASRTIFFAGFEQLKGLFFVGLSEFLSADGD